MQDGTGNREQALSLYAQSAVLMDADSGRILYGKDEQQIRPMASTTKIMTCILALELGNPEDFCEVSQKASAQPKVKLGAPAGQPVQASGSSVFPDAGVSQRLRRGDRGAY